MGAAAYLTDLLLFVWLRGPRGTGPLTAKALAFLGGCAVAYLGNRFGPYRHRSRHGSEVRHLAAFLAVNAAGALVQLSCLGVSHYGLGLTSPLADTVSGNVVGMALATALRFWGTRTWVFGQPVMSSPPCWGEDRLPGVRRDGAP